MKFQNAFCCFQKTQKCSSPFFFEDPLFFKDGLRSVLLFFKDGGGPRRPKKRGMHPPFLFFLWIASSGMVQEKLGPKLRPPQTLYLPGKGETQTMVRVWGVLGVGQRTAKGAGGKGRRQKSSKSVKNMFDTCRHFSRRAKNVKNRQKVSNYFSTLLDNFRAAPVFRPLLGDLSRDR